MKNVNNHTRFICIQQYLTGIQDQPISPHQLSVSLHLPTKCPITSTAKIPKYVLSCLWERADKESLATNVKGFLYDNS